MKQENNENRPSFGLMKLNNIISYYHMQMPRWLFSDSGYSDMTLESKVAYTFLLNRFQLSRRNGWVNRYGEVYVIYTREDLAREMQISYRKAIACFKELTEKHLVWEQRQGRGLPNRIYLAEVVFAEKAAFSYDCAPFSANENRPAEIAGLENEDDMDSNKKNCSEMPDTDAEPLYTAASDLSELQCKTCENGTSRGAETAVQDLPKPHTSKKEIRNTENSFTEESSFIGRSTRTCGIAGDRTQSRISGFRRCGTQSAGRLPALAVLLQRASHWQLHLSAGLMCAKSCGD